jgi:hypothetical protein
LDRQEENFTRESGERLFVSGNLRSDVSFVARRPSFFGPFPAGEPTRGAGRARGTPGGFGQIRKKARNEKKDVDPAVEGERQNQKQRKTKVLKFFLCLYFGWVTSVTGETRREEDPVFVKSRDSVRF